MNHRTITLAITASVALSGCGLRNPDAVKAPAAVPLRAPVAPTGLRTPPMVVGGQHDRLVLVAVDYALTQATWSPDTYVAQQAHLAALSTGAALAELTPRPGEPPAAVAARLAAAGSSSRATMIGVDHPSPREVVVAYKTTATGLGRSSGHADYAIAHLTFSRHAQSWLVSNFAIQP